MASIPPAAYAFGSDRSQKVPGNMTYTTLSYPQPDVALLELDHPESSVNLLSSDMLAEIESHLLEIEPRTDVVGLVIASAKAGSFVAGADLKEFVAGLDRPQAEVIETSRRGQELFQRLAKLPQVSVAAIDGICVGGGAELAIWCDGRVAVSQPKTQLGFPEVKLGLFPGWGGTARLPRMIGLANAVEMITGGESLSADECYQLGLVDDHVELAKELVPAAVRMIHAEIATSGFLDDRERWSQPIATSETELGFLGATANALIQQKTGGHYPAPLVALELLLEASMVDIDEALELERQRFAPLFGSPVNRGLLNVFFLQDRNKKQATGESGIERVAVVGAGTMGQGIAAVALRRGFDVVIDDARREVLSTAEQAVIDRAAYDRELKGANPTKVLELAPHISAAASPAQVAGCDLIVEAIIEQAEAKHELFASLDKSLGERAILASNTSTLPITGLAKGLKQAERFCGLHFFNPVHRMPLVEVIRGDQTSDATINRAVAFAKQLGKSPIVVNDGPGFLVNRLLLPYMNEAAIMASEGTPLEQIDRAAKSFGMPMGPIELHDVVGLDVCLHAGRVMRDAFPDRVVETPILAALVDAGRLGQKNKKGFFDWREKKGKLKKSSSHDVEKLLAQHKLSSENVDVEPADRLMFPMLLEATRALDDGIVSDPRDVDLALILGIGFPPFRGGLLFWADQLGIEEINSRLEKLAPLGDRFEPTPMIQKMLDTDSKFY